MRFRGLASLIDDERLSSVEDEFHIPFPRITSHHVCSTSTTVERNCYISVTTINTSTRECAPQIVLIREPGLVFRSDRRGRRRSATGC
jgi:hypothetical protein